MSGGPSKHSECVDHHGMDGDVQGTISADLTFNCWPYGLDTSSSCYQKPTNVQQRSDMLLDQSQTSQGCGTVHLVTKQSKHSMPLTSRHRKHPYAVVNAYEFAAEV